MREGEHEHSAIQRNGAGEPGFGAWVPFVPSLLVCVDVRARAQETRRRQQQEQAQNGLNVMALAARQGFARERLPRP